MEKIKKIIVGVAVFIILLAAVVAVLGVTRKNTPGANDVMRNGTGMSDGGFAFPASDSVAPMQKALPESAGMMSSETMMLDDVSGGGLPMGDRRVVKTGHLDLKVNDADSAAEKISQIAKSNDGDVQTSSFYENTKGIKSGTVAVKVPVDNFERAFAEIKAVATLVVRESVSGQDVTEEYSDLQAQLKNKQAEEQSFLKILDMSGKISDILDVTRELSRVRGEIEMLQGRLRFMDSQTDMSTIVASLTEDAEVTFSDSWRPWQVVKETFNALFKDIQGFVNFVIVLVIRIIPLAVLSVITLALMYWIGRKIYSRVKK
ncbi:MAG: DUF4349 domain-containing protein [Candidatus Moranbacteria bacterium]|nr:DUF4349 domain-containing protein [Candidatus Moranbacteria bacterium]